MAKLLRNMLDLLWPQGVACSLCGCELDPGGPLLCASCATELSHSFAYTCPGCGRPSDRPERCHSCRQQGDIAEHCIAALSYQARARQVVVAFKMNDKTGYAPLLASLMTQSLRQAGLAEMLDCVVPVPMHLLRRIHRGYNQSELLAREVAHAIDRPMLRHGLCRPVYTPPTARQHGTATERIHNARRSYGPGRTSVAGKTVLLVDDILTTGSTLRVCAALLQAQGAACVIVLVAAAVPEVTVRP